MSTSTASRRWPFIAAIVIGLGLALAPVAFQMFTRAPHGGTMIKGFKPYMTTTTIDGFRRDLSVIDAAHQQSSALLGTPDAAARYPSVASFDSQWPSINNDMGSMLTTMRSDIGRYRGVAALPPFVLFPWFFVVPGLLIAAIAGSALLAQRRGDNPFKRRRALAVLGLGLIAAPAIFQMFTRAPGGQAMISDFKPFMTTAKVTQIQSYFLTIGAAEGQLRLDVLPSDIGRTASPSAVTDIKTLNREWPDISATMAPMIGAMSDNVANFQGVAALPPFGLFPWFFVIPGVLVLGLSVATRRSVAAVGALATALTGCGGSGHASTSAGTSVTGLLRITAGSCTGGHPSGSYFRMQTPSSQGGKASYVSNADSTCNDKTLTLLAPGRAGGLRLGTYQSQPETAFLAGGNSASSAIIAPAKFFAVDFGVSTNAKDPQTGIKVPAPTATQQGSTFTVNLPAWSVAWNHQEFNQGAPKPGSGGVQATGTLDPSTGVYTLEWTSKIKDGPFNGFTGMWHLTGTLTNT